MSAYENQIKQWIGEWKSRFEEMQVQLSLGKMDAITAFEEQKKLLRRAVTEWETELMRAAKNEKADLEAKLEELKVQLALGKAEGLEKFEEQRKRIEKALQEVKAEGKKLYATNKDDFRELFENNASAFKTGLEVLQLQFSLAKLEAKGEAEDLKKQLAEKMEQLNTNWVDIQKSAEKNWNSWSQQAEEGLEKAKGWANDFLKKLK